MTLPRILILGVLALVVIWLIASIVAMLVPYAAVGLVLWIGFVAIQKALAAKDTKELQRQHRPPSNPN